MRAPTQFLSALACLLVLSAAPAGGQVGTAPAEPQVTPTDEPAPDDGTTPAVDPTAEAVLPGLPAPLQPPVIGSSADEIAARTVPGPAQTGPDLTATGAVLFDPADQVMLLDKDARVPRPMASTTKIMTVLLALEAEERGEIPEVVTVSAEAVRVASQPGRASLGLEVDQTLPLDDVLAGLLLRSGNDGAVVVAEAFGGNETAYAAMMTARAQQLGLEDTAFLDASGLSDDPAHHATPLDLAKLGAEAMRYEDFARWAGSAALDVDGLGQLVNRNELIGVLDGATGVKTGFTSLAGYCLVASAERDGRVLYAVVLGSASSQQRFAEAAALLEHGFTDFARPVVFEAGDAAASYRWTDVEVPLEVAEPLTRTVGAGAQLSLATVLAPDVALPVSAGTPLGEIRLAADGEVIQTLPLLAAQDVGPAAESPGAALADALRAFTRLQPAMDEVRESVPAQ